MLVIAIVTANDYCQLSGNEYSNGKWLLVIAIQTENGCW